MHGIENNGGVGVHCASVPELFVASSLSLSVSVSLPLSLSLCPILTRPTEPLHVSRNVAARRTNGETLKRGTNGSRYIRFSKQET